VLFEPKRQRKAISEKRVGAGADLPFLARQRECHIEGRLMPDHVHRCITILPKHPRTSLIGFLKKSAIPVARLDGREGKLYRGTFWGARLCPMLVQFVGRIGFQPIARGRGVPKIRPGME
jgi:putative transposase